MWATDVAPGWNILGEAAKLIFLPPQLLPKNEQGAHRFPPGVQGAHFYIPMCDCVFKHRL